MNVVLHEVNWEVQFFAFEVQSRYYGRRRLGMSTTTLGFAVADEDRPLLAELVDYFGGGNRSAYLRATLRIMSSVKLAGQLRQLQAYGPATSC